MENSIELIGWIATATILYSFTIKSDMAKLRKVNLIGSLMWMSYGGLKDDHPIIIVNTAVVLIHTYWFIKNRKK